MEFETTKEYTMKTMREAGKSIKFFPYSYNESENVQINLMKLNFTDDSKVCRKNNLPFGTHIREAFEILRGN